MPHAALMDHRFGRPSEQQIVFADDIEEFVGHASPLPENSDSALFASPSG